MDNFENQDLGGLPILKKETPRYSIQLTTKTANTPSVATTETVLVFFVAKPVYIISTPQSAERIIAFIIPTIF